MTHKTPPYEEVRLQKTGDSVVTAWMKFCKCVPHMNTVIIRCSNPQSGMLEAIAIASMLAESILGNPSQEISRVLELCVWMNASSHTQSVENL